MNTYRLEIYNYSDDGTRFETVVAETAAKAKGKFIQYSEMLDSLTFLQALQWIKSVRLVHKFHYSDLFGDRERFDDMKQRRFIEFARLGMRVEVCGKPGRIVGANSGGNLDVCFDGQCHAENCHPYWKVKYFDDNGTLIKEFDGK